ncbi:FAD-linked oxidoreductase-like protein [Dactylonectria macrodidyma]|uniref:Proline dehydrogenase n=1 Tax=Dactylonectria macrodidyma TaxID=307937 RepID=A0A9P9I8Q8_9HYPO|nr:FAD-linked oxidoreductase-like protein [Dactylonectria macrodidyma]
MLFATRQRFCLAARHFPAAISQRTIRSASTSAEPRAILKNALFRDERIACVAGGTTVAIIGLLWAKGDGSEYPDDPRDVKALSTVPVGKLFSGWAAFAFCSSPTWVDMSETLYNIVSKIPIVSSLRHAFVMRTLFNQFLGGETTEDCIPKIEALRKEQIGTLLGYNIEAELDAQGKLGKQYCPDTSATGGDNRSWVRIKVTGLLTHPVALYHGCNAILKAREEKGLDKTGRGVTESDRQQLLSLRATLEVIASKARDNNVRIVIDAEQSWYHPVIDSLTDELMQKYNALDGPATCIASFQAYLRRYPQLLDQQIRRTDEKGYKLLFKQIRGAYMVTEAERWKKEERQGTGPVWATKAEKDASFNYGIEKTLSTVAAQVRETGHSKISVVFSTHNSISIDLGIKLLKKHG